MQSDPLHEDVNHKPLPTQETTTTNNIEEEKGNRLIALWERILRLGIAEPILRTSTHIIIIITVLFAVLAMRVFNSNVEQVKQADLLSTAQAIAEPTVNPDGGNGSGLVIAHMPSFNLPETMFPSGIPRFALIDTTIPSRERVEIILYEVQTGDNVFSIADKYGLKPESILWGNYDVLKDNPQLLSPGQQLNILPVDGVLHRWSVGENLRKVAEFFGVGPEAIIEFQGNNLDPYTTDLENPGLVDGTLLIVPGGERELTDWGPPAIPRENPASAAYYGPGHCGQIYEGLIGYGTFVWPTTQTNVSGYDYNPNIHPAIDIGGKTGNPIFAVDSGVVVYAGLSNYGYGNLIVIDHGNGWQSAYAHLDSVGVSCGQSATQGSVIGSLGSTGNSSGPHLHFELRSELYGKVNPLDYLFLP
jgi:murein DD-endopeptidase MepM/ murein hydrolase activator NlpD